MVLGTAEGTAGRADPGPGWPAGVKGAGAGPGLGEPRAATLAGGVVATLSFCSETGEGVGGA